MTGVGGGSGLTRAEVAERVARGEVNDVPARPSRTIAQIVRANVLTRFNALLGGLLLVILVVGPLQDALFAGVLIANTVVGVVQEVRAKRTLDRLAVLTAATARVVRDGAAADVPVSQVVLDDVLELRPGDQVVVDGEVLDARGLEIDESLLSGESHPVDKQVGAPVWSGAFVVAGTGRYRATRVGRAAYAVALAEQARRFTLVHSELRAGIDRILQVVTWVLVPTAAVLVASQLRASASVREAVRASVAGTIGMVPEGLVLLTSVAFAVGVLRLARRRVVVQELPAVEVLARVDTLCIDKTGTLTEGRLVVEEVLAVDGAAAGAPPGAAEALAALAAADPAPNATMRAIASAFPAPAPGCAPAPDSAPGSAPAPDSAPGSAEAWAVTAWRPFSSARAWSGATFEGRGTWLLGAPEVLLGRPPEGGAADGGAAGREAPGGEAPGGGAMDVAGRLAAAGRRVLVLARTEADVEPGPAAVPAADAVALVVLADRVRPDAARTLEYFAGQGVAVKVISGDHPATVAAIARRLGLPGTDVVDARPLGTDGDALAAALREHDLFGRVAPEQKRAMVAALRRDGHVVAMTGDGVNDVPALKEADLGIAMGAGSAATRAVAQLVLLDSAFEALPSVVAEGRRVLANIERTANLYLTKTVYAMLLALGVGVVGLPFPFLPRHLTVIGTFTIGVPSFFLALAPDDTPARRGFLRRVVRFTLPAGGLTAVATFLAYRLAVEEPGVSLAQARTTATMVLCWIGLLVLTVIAAPLTRTRLLLVWSMAAGFVAVLLAPFTGSFFALEPPPLIVWLAGFGIAALVWSLSRLLIPPDRPIGPTPPRDHEPRRDHEVGRDHEVQQADELHDHDGVHDHHQVHDHGGQGSGRVPASTRPATAWATRGGDSTPPPGSPT